MLLNLIYSAIISVSINKNLLKLKSKWIKDLFSHNPLPQLYPISLSFIAYLIFFGFFKSRKSFGLIPKLFQPISKIFNSVLSAKASAIKFPDTAVNLFQATPHSYILLSFKKLASFIPNLSVKPFLLKYNFFNLKLFDK